MRYDHIAGAATLISLLGCATAANADGMFLQLDVGADVGTAVVSVERGRLTFGALHTVYKGGETSRLSVLYKLPLDWSGAIRVGPSLDYISKDDGQDAFKPEVRVTLDRYAETSFGSLPARRDYQR